MIDPLSIAGLGFTAATVASLLVLHFRKVEVPRVGTWAEPPTIYVYPTIYVHDTVGEAMREIKAARRFWRELGFKLGPVKLQGPFDPLWSGGIHISGTPWEKGVGGRATIDLIDFAEQPVEGQLSAIQDVAHIELGLIIEARISIDPMLTKDERMKALRHELGHALGFMHCRTPLSKRKKKQLKKRGGLVGRKSGHVMHPLLSRCGTGTQGIKP